MTLELVAALVAAVGMAGVALALRRMTGERLPKWSVPAAAALGLLGFTLWSEYSWFSRVSAQLPAEAAVVWQARDGQILRPWTYAVPLTSRFVALDRREVALNPDLPDLRMATLYSFARWQPTQSALVAVDCGTGQLALMVEGAKIAPDGQLTGAAWTPPAAGDATVTTVCAAG
jgi:hypothetical protein